MKRLLLIAITCASFATWVLAQDPEPATAAPTTTAPENAQESTAPADDGYLPSEEISDDLSVSFPVDI